MKMIEDLGMMYAEGKKKWKYRYALYECPFCGNTFKTSVSTVNKGQVTSCGCNRYKSRIVHGMSRTPMYQSWKDIKARCHRPNHAAYEYYGGRGISMCDEWRNDFMAFYNWSMNNGYETGLDVDRINNNGNYEPSNCRWVNHLYNTYNRRIQSDNKSGYKGVIKHHTGKWRVSINSDRSTHYVGLFVDVVSAARAYDEAAKKYHGKYAVLNFPENE